MSSRSLGLTCPWGVVLIVALTVLHATTRPALAQTQAGTPPNEALPTNCEQPGGQSAPGSFSAAVKVFRSEDQAWSIPLFSEIIDDLGVAPRNAVEAALLACSLRYRAEARLNLGPFDEADRDLHMLCDVAPSFVFDRQIESPRLVERFDSVCLVAWLRVIVSPRTAEVAVNGVRVDPANPILVKPGVVHQVTARRDDRTDSEQVQVERGASLDIQLEVPRGRLPTWPATLGIIGAGGMLAMTLLEDDKVKKEVAKRQLPRADLELIQKRRDSWRLGLEAAAGFSLAYLVLRPIVGGSSNESDWQLSVDPSSGGVHMTWRLSKR